MSACGIGPGIGPDDCREPAVVYVEFEGRSRLGLAGVMCHRHAAELRSTGIDPGDRYDWADDAPYTVTGYRSVPA